MKKEKLIDVCFNVTGKDDLIDDISKILLEDGVHFTVIPLVNCEKFKEKHPNIVTGDSMYSSGKNDIVIVLGIDSLDEHKQRLLFGSAQMLARLNTRVILITNDMKKVVIPEELKGEVNCVMFSDRELSQEEINELLGTDTETNIQTEDCDDEQSGEFEVLDSIFERVLESADDFLDIIREMKETYKNKDVFEHAYKDLLIPTAYNYYLNTKLGLVTASSFNSLVDMVAIIIIFDLCDFLDELSISIPSIPGQKENRNERVERIGGDMICLLTDGFSENNFWNEEGYNDADEYYEEYICNQLIQYCLTAGAFNLE